MPKKGGLVDLREGGTWQERAGVFLRRGADTPMRTVSSPNNLKVTPNYYEKKFLLIIRKNKKHSSKQAIPITYTLKRRVFDAATFQGLLVVSFQTK